MDLFRANLTTSGSMTEGILVGPRINATWVERYRDHSIFDISAYVHTGIRELLPIGSVISHVDSNIPMIVENHEITSKKNEIPVVKLSGRGFETILENRIVGSAKAMPHSGRTQEYTIGAYRSWNQIRTLIRNHITPGVTPNVNDEMPNLEVYTDLGAGPGTSEERTIARGDLYSEVVKLLAVDKLGMYVHRPRIGSPASTDTNSVIVIHGGVNRYDNVDTSKNVVFSFSKDELDSADYLWSNQKLKTQCDVTSKWFQVRVQSKSATGYNRRIMHIDASDIDEKWEAAPDGGWPAWIMSQMTLRGREALAKQHDIALIKADASRNTVNSVFRKNYYLGDIVRVAGEYRESGPMRVTEYAEIEDSNGTIGYPTFSSIEDEEE